MALSRQWYACRLHDEEKALSELLSVCELHFPKTRRESVMREYRQSRIEVCRRTRKGEILHPSR